MANILIGITGSVAAFKVVPLIRDLTKHGHNVKVILTNDGMKFISAQLIAAIGVEVYSDTLIDYTNPKQAMLHIDLAKFADLFMIVPASANTIAKLAHGIADSLLAQAVLVYDGVKPIIVVPAMNQAMWKNSITQSNIEILERHKFNIIYPQDGIQACGDTGFGRMVEVEEVFNYIQSLVIKLDNQQTIIISLGATIEPLDPVRFISNHSSGKMGVALVKQALTYWYKVIAVCGKISEFIQPHENLKIINVTSADDMLAKIDYYANSADVFISCAAVADYKAENIASQKIKKDADNDSITIKFVKNPDIVATIAKKYPQLFCVGFAAETENILENAQQKLIKKSLKMIVANDVSDNKVFDKDVTKFTILNANKTLHISQNVTKDEAAKIILQNIQQEYELC